MSKIICNPMNLEYRYQQIGKNGQTTLSREAADPTVILFHDKYLLFASMQGGFFWSDDMESWQYKPTPELPIYDYAPDVREIDGKIVFSASNYRKASFFVSEDPLTVPFRKLDGGFPWWDPNIFQDDDGRVYFYWGSSTKPLWGVEVDRNTLSPIGKKVQLFGANERAHGWERMGEDNIKPEPPKNLTGKLLKLYAGDGAYIEGVYMTKHDGRYYLQYAAPDTQCNVYADGVYVGEHPLGPFVYQRHNPFSSIPAGYFAAAGHGSTFQDKSGKWWHATTMRISVNEKFERRLGLFPCAFDEDGILHCDQTLADYPFDLETGKKSGWMLLSGTATALTSQHGYGPEKALEENVRTNWAATRAGEDQWLTIDFGEAKTVQAVQVNFADHKLSPLELFQQDVHKDVMGTRKIFDPQVTEYLLEGSEDNTSWTIIRDTRGAGRDYSHDFIVLETPKQFRFVRLAICVYRLTAYPPYLGFEYLARAMENLLRKSVKRRSNDRIP